MIALLISACAPAVNPNPDDDTEVTGNTASSNQSTGDDTQGKNDPSGDTESAGDTESSESSADEGTQIIDDLDLPSKIPPEIPYEYNHYYKMFRYQAGKNVSDYNDNYYGKRFTTDGMQDGRLYAVDDGEIYTITEQEVPFHGYDHDFINNYIYFVLKDDARKVWRTDHYGNELTLIYESQHGDISWVRCHPLGFPGRLLILENDNRGIFYNLTTQKVTVLLEAYYIEQLSYDIAEQRVNWKGQLNKDVPAQSPYWDTYRYYVKTGEYEMLIFDKVWMPVKQTDS